MLIRKIITELLIVDNKTHPIDPCTWVLLQPQPLHPQAADSRICTQQEVTNYY